MISIEAVTKSYGSLTALHETTLHIPEGEVFGLIGPNGAGKTTTIRILATLLRPTAGRVTLGGIDLLKQPAAARRILGYMPDFAGAYEDMRVTEYLSFFASAAGIRDAKAKSIVADVLELTDLAYKADALVETLSRGMRQRLGLARVLLHDPKVLLLDEPASGLDPRARVEMRLLLKELCSMKKTIVISSHILPELAELCTSVGIIERGRLLFSGNVRAFQERCRRRNVAQLRVEPPPRGEGEEAAHAAGGAGNATRRAVETLAAQPEVAKATAEQGLIEIELAPGETDLTQIPALLADKGFRIHYFTDEPVSLEDAFMRLTRGEVQ